MKIESNVVFVKYKGFFFKEEAEEAKKENKLLGTTRVINFVHPFSKAFYKGPESDYESDLNGMWIDKIFERQEYVNPQLASQGEESWGFEGESTASQSVKIKTAHIIVNNFLSQEIDDLRNNGNYAEVYAYKKLIGKELEEEDFVDSYGFLIRKTELGIIYGKYLYKGLLKLLGDPNDWNIYYQLPLGSWKDRTVGIIDFLFVNKETNESILVDTKTGANVEGDKLNAVILQLMGSYAPKITEVFDFYPDKSYCVSAYVDKIQVTPLVKQWAKSYKNIDLSASVGRRRTRPNRNGLVRKEFEELTKIYKILDGYGHIK